MKTKSLASFFLAGTLAAIGLTSSVSEALIGGNKARVGALPGSVFMSVLDYEFCSGVVISPHHILMAAHCVTGWTRYKLTIGNMLEIKTYNNPQSDDYYDNEFEGEIKAIYVHPSWPLDLDAGDKASLAKHHLSNGDVSSLSDLAIIEIDEEINGNASGLFPVRLDFSPTKPGDDVYMTGAGCQKADGTYTGTLKVAAKKITALHGNDLVMPMQDSDKGTASLCNGDSGSAVYHKDAKGMSVVGINSTTENLWIFGGKNMSVRLDANGAESWIQQVMAGKIKASKLPDSDN